MQRKGGGGRQQRRKKSANEKENANPNRKRDDHAQLAGSEQGNWRSYSRAVALLAVVVLFAGLLYLAAPGSYTRSRLPRSQEAAERRTSKVRKESAKGMESGEDDQWVRAAREGSSCEELVNEARKIMSTGVTEGDQAELALDMLASCALKEPESAIPRWNIAAALMQMKRVDEALPFMNKALSLDPTNLGYLLNGGRVLAGLGRHREAVKCLEKYLEVSLHIQKWEQLLASISVMREDEWEFLNEVGPNLVPVLELLLNSYLHETSLIKAGYMYKLVIGLKGVENARELVLAHSFFCFSLGDVTMGIKQLRVYTEEQYVLQGYGDVGQAKEVVTAHSLRLLTAGFDAIVVSIAKNLLMSGRVVWEELVYNCNLEEEDKHDFSVWVPQKWLWGIFVKCLLMQDVIPSLLQNGAIVHAENIFGFTPLLNMVSLDSPELVQQILTARANSEARTAMGLTSLHMAAIRGSYHAVLPLIQTGLQVNSSDGLNRTAMDVACLQRWSAANISRVLRIQLPNGCPIKPTYLPPLEQGFKHGGWLGSGAILPAELTEERCDFDVIGYTADTETLLLNYLALQRPVVVRNATNHHQMKRLFQLWQRNKMAKEYGHLTFTEVLVPYAESFGYNHSMITLRKFLDKMEQTNKEYRMIKDPSLFPSPTYIFETIPPNSPLLEHFTTPAIFNPSLTHISTTKTQFYVGPPLSGAPVHFHRNAWNVLFYGQKRWFLFPPPFAVYSKQHVWDWWKTRHGNRPFESAWECVQHPGDLVFVPDMWGHAVINLKESVGLAAEFIHGASEFSL